MSIRSYFKPASSLPTSETRIGTIATTEANRSVQRVLDEQRCQQPLSKRRKYTFFMVTSVPKFESCAAENAYRSLT